ncbi:MAG: hypothetical protein AAGK05_19295 [Pseudomonadota bacterium]
MATIHVNFLREEADKVWLDTLFDVYNSSAFDRRRAGHAHEWQAEVQIWAEAKKID